MTVKRLVAILACAAVSAASVRAWNNGQTAPSDDAVQRDRFMLLSRWDRDPKTLQELNDLAAMGYRVVFASPSDLLLEWPPRNDTGDGVHYLFLRPRPIAEFQSHVNELIAHGSRIVTHAGLTTLIEAAEGAETPTSARRPATEASRYEFQVIRTFKPGKDLSNKEFEEHLSRAVNDGFQVVDMMTVADEQGDSDRTILRGRVVLLRRVVGNEHDRPSAPVSVDVKWVKASKRNLDKYRSQGYRLRHIGWGTGSANSDLLFEKTADSTAGAEYAVVEFWASTPERALNELASRGFRLLRHGEITSLCCSRPLSGVSTLIMEKQPGVASVEYRVLELATLNAAASQGPIEGAAVGVIRIYGRLWARVVKTLVVWERPLGR